MRLNVAYGCGDEYSRHAGVSMISLFENNKEFEEIVVYMIDAGMNDNSKKTLIQICENYNRTIEFIDCSELCGHIELDIANGRYTIATYSKLFFGKIPGIDKIIYFDCDTTITGSLKMLWEKNIDDYYVAGVWDDAAPRLKRAVGITSEDKYINCGFVLMNLKLWREDKMEEKALSFIRKFNGNVPFLDQGIINGICKGRILILPPEYDLMSYMFMFKAKEIARLCDLEKMYSQEEINYAINNPIMIHWVDGCYNRPWNLECTHPLKDIYLKYLDMSPWKGQMLSKKLNKKTKIIRLVYLITPFCIFSMLRKLSDERKGKIVNEK